MMDKTINVYYFAMLREQAGPMNEEIQTCAETALELFEELSSRYEFSLNVQSVRVAVNEQFQPWNVHLSSKDTVAFIPPMCGG